MVASPSALTALSDFAGAVLPLSARDLQAQIDERLAQIPNAINRYGYDAYGMSPRWWQTC